MADDSIRGHFVWHELMTTDTKSAASFFTNIIGWKTQAFPQDPSYTFFATDRPMAGLMMLPDGGKGMGGRPVWVSYIGSPNVDETSRQAVKLGGKILKQPADIPTVGRFAVLEDPQGAVFNAFTPLPVPGPSAAGSAPAIGDFSWHELPTTDWRAALTFYKGLFGWEETSAMDMGPEMGTYQMFGLAGKPFGGIFNKPKEMPGPPAWLPYIHVLDAKKTAGAVKKLGGQVINGPMEVPGGDWIVTGLDLQGAMFAVHSLKPAAAAAKKPAAKKPAPKAAKKAVKKAAKKAVKKAARKAKQPKAAKRKGAKKAAKSSARRGAARKAKKKAPKRRR